MSASNIIIKQLQHPELTTEYDNYESSVRGDGLKVLIVDDDETNRVVLEAMLSKEGHSIAMAENGEEAISVFEREQPDIIFMDIMMPVMNGYEAATEIKKKLGTELVPIIFITAVTNDESLAKCLQAGGDDFITKPISRVILKAKLAAADRMRRLYLQAMDQRRDLEKIHERLRSEHEMAEHILARIVSNTSFKRDNIKVHQSSMAISSGDIVIASDGPGNMQRIFIGDSTGHGLSAAIGALPISDIFYAMTKKGFGIRDIVLEMNKKLHDTLPTGHFIAACIIDWFRDDNKLRVWNGGIPDGILISRPGKEITRLESKNLPLGVVGNESLDIEIVARKAHADDRVYFYTDGVIDAVNENGEEFGESRVEAIILDAAEGINSFDELRSQVDFHTGGHQNDDITLVELLCDMDELDAACQDISENNESYCDKIFTWSLDRNSIKKFDPLSVVDELITNIPSLENNKSIIYTIVRELYGNSLEHGILKLNTDAKATPEGFSQYYQMREELLSRLESGWILIEIEYVHHGQKCELIIQVEDSGEGFLIGNQAAESDGNYSEIGGRGIKLVGALCKRLEYDRYGNHVRAVYDLLTG